MSQVGAPSASTLSAFLAGDAAGPAALFLAGVLLRLRFLCDLALEFRRRLCCGKPPPLAAASLMPPLNALSRFETASWVEAI